MNNERAGTCHCGGQREEVILKNGWRGLLCRRCARKMWKLRVDVLGESRAAQMCEIERWVEKKET